MNNRPEIANFGVTRGTVPLKPILPAMIVSLISLACNADRPIARMAEDDGCQASLSWITNPNPPAEIASGETFCDFHQFAWQWFLDQTQPTEEGSNQRKWEQLPIWQPDENDQCADPMLGSSGTPGGLFVRTIKGMSPPFEPQLPDERGQAGGGSALYDQSGHVVFYNVRYNEAECRATADGFLAGTMEIKTSWRPIDPVDSTRFYSIEARIDSLSDQPLLLGLVGFHLVRNTERHREFIWATFEHKDNAPDSTDPGQPPTAGWSFTSAACAQCLPSGCPTSCRFNTPDTSKGLTGTPTEVYRRYRDGTGRNFSSNPDNNSLNRAAIDSLNSQLVGPDGYLASLPDTNRMAIWRNYFLVGALWTTKGLGSDTLNQRGSLQLANTTMETFHQDLNCFTCHSYDPSTPLETSHIYRSLGRGTDEGR